MKISDIKPGEYDVYYGRYLAKLDAFMTLGDALEEGRKHVQQFFSEVPAERLRYRYADNKWSVCEVFQHLVDTERIFIYRAFRIARGDTTPLANFDQTRYMETSGVDQKSLDQLIQEFETGRRASISIMASLTKQDLSRMGMASERPISARAAAAVIPGHDKWHMEIIEQKYL